jgi:N-methylhydantoinase B
MSSSAKKGEPMGSVNPITMETIKNRLVAIGREMVSTMARTAGTPIYAEIKDFSCGLFDYKARQVVYSGMAITHNLAIQNLVQTTIRLHGDDPGISEGDVFMGNDPYLGGGIHAQELGLVSPIFLDDEIIAWSGSIAHQLDIGGMNPGGFCMDAVDCFQEGIRFPPVRLYHKGELQKDIWNIHRNNVRLPEKISMELKGQVAANHVAKMRITEMVRKLGAETFRDITDALIKLSERVTEERIRQIPAGVYEHMDFGEVEGLGDGLLRIHCDLIVKDGKLIFDFTKDCPQQLQKFINSTKLVVKGMVCSYIMPMLCHDVPWNEGCTYPVEIVTTPGTVLDAQPPAPSGCPHISFRAADAALGALNKALYHSPLRDRITSCWTSSPPVILGMAMGPGDGRPIFVPVLEGMSGGGGAFSSKDGLDVGASLSIMEYSMGDVETQENAYPVLYLTRRILRDSGGPGRFRGGAGSLVALVPHKTGGIRFFLVEDRRLVPPHGSFGGYPGASNFWFVGRQLDLSAVLRQGSIEPDYVLAEMELLKPIGIVDLGPRDVFLFSSNGGGGYGDPLNRDPRKVARDVKWGFVSRRKAQQIYGVAFGHGTVEIDEEQTRGMRRNIREGRLPQGMIPKRDAVSLGGDYISLKETDRGVIQYCSNCGEELGSFKENWKESVDHKDLNMNQTGVFIPGDERVVLREYICRYCGHILDREVTLRALGPVWDFKPAE